jgi:hypothetical protein
VPGQRSSLLASCRLEERHVSGYWLPTWLPVPCGVPIAAAGRGTRSQGQHDGRAVARLTISTPGMASNARFIAGTVLLVSDRKDLRPQPNWPGSTGQPCDAGARTAWAAADRSGRSGQHSPPARPITMAGAAGLRTQSPTMSTRWPPWQLGCYGQGFVAPFSHAATPRRCPWARSGSGALGSARQ